MAEALAVSPQELSHKEYRHAASEEIDNAEEESGNAEAKNHLGNSLLKPDRRCQFEATCL
jgi:hypothetical protein